jgi:tRNA-2-methylthio-N6-dimethylallyladenosine synthase
MSDDLIAAHRDEPKLMPNLHLPFQAGSDRVLAAMNRRHTRSDYLALIARIRAARPDIALSTDVIVGFPGETDEEFKATLSLLEQVGFAQAYTFKYSPRPGTPAADMDQLPDALKDERLQRVLEVVARSQTSFNSRCVGTAVAVLLEHPGRHPGQLVGRSPYLQSVHVPAPTSLCGHVVEVEIEAAGPNSLAGRLISATRISAT